MDVVALTQLADLEAMSRRDVTTSQEVVLTAPGTKLPAVLLQT